MVLRHVVMLNDLIMSSAIMSLRFTSEVGEVAINAGYIDWCLSFLKSREGDGSRPEESDVNSPILAMWWFGAFVFSHYDVVVHTIKPRQRRSTNGHFFVASVSNACASTFLTSISNLQIWTWYVE